MSIVLIGAPGAGKSSVGKRVARKLGLSFVDVDDRIEEVLGKSIREIFADEGEAYFRAAEEEATIELLGTSDVVSLGGGAVMNERIRAALARWALTVAVDDRPGASVAMSRPNAFDTPVHPRLTRRVGVVFFVPGASRASRRASDAVPIEGS